MTPPTLFWRNSLGHVTLTCVIRSDLIGIFMIACFWNVIFLLGGAIFLSSIWWMITLDTFGVACLCIFSLCFMMMYLSLWLWCMGECILELGILRSLPMMYCFVPLHVLMECTSYGILTFHSLTICIGGNFASHTWYFFFYYHYSLIECENIGILASHTWLSYFWWHCALVECANSGTLISSCIIFSSIGALLGSLAWWSKPIFMSSYLQ